MMSVGGSGRGSPPSQERAQPNRRTALALTSQRRFQPGVLFTVHQRSDGHRLTVVGGAARRSFRAAGSATAVNAPRQDRRERRDETLSGTPALRTTAEVPSDPPGEGRCQMSVVPFVTRRLPAVCIVLTRVDAIVPLES